MSRLPIVALGAAALALAGCTHGPPGPLRPSPVGVSSALPQGDVDQLCSSYARAKRVATEFLDRIEAHAEPASRFDGDIEAIDLLSRHLYASAAPFANRGDGIPFRVANRLASALNKLVFNEFQNIEPSQITPPIIRGVRDGLAGFEAAVTGGDVPCSKPG